MNINQLVEDIGPLVKRYIDAEAAAYDALADLYALMNRVEGLGNNAGLEEMLQMKHEMIGISLDLLAKLGGLNCERVL